MDLPVARWGTFLSCCLLAAFLALPACDLGPVERDARLTALESTLLSREMSRETDRIPKPQGFTPKRDPIGAPVDPLVSTEAPLSSELSIEERAKKYLEHIDGHYIAILDRRALALAGIHDAKVFADKLKLEPRRIYNRALMGFSVKLSDAQLLRLQGDPRVAHLQPDSIMFTQARPVPKGTNRVDADVNPHASIDGVDDRVGVTVAVVDTGIDLDHIDLNVVGGIDFCSLDPDTGGNDLMGHGTHCAGIIGALDNGYDFDYGLGGNPKGIVGNAPGTPVFAVRILDADGAGAVSDIIAGLEWITACVSGDNPNPACPAAARNIRVANMSIGCDCANPYCWCFDNCGGQNCNDAFEAAIEGMMDAGVLAVVAAGNSDLDVGDSDATCHSSPSCFDAPLVVASMTDFDGQRGELSTCPSDCAYTSDTDDQRATYSNYGDQVDIIAPGTCIESTYHLGDQCADCVILPTLCGSDTPTMGCDCPVGQYQCCKNGCNNCGPCMDCAPDNDDYRDVICSTSTDDYCCWYAPYVTMSGTSMASPAVAGGAALYIEEYRKNNGSDPSAYDVKTALMANGEQLPCRSGAGGSCSDLPGVPGLYLGELRDSIEVSGYSVDFMFLDGAGFGSQTGADAFEGSQSLHMGVNDAGDPVHGYSCVQFCLKAGSLSDPLVNYLQASFRMKLDQLTSWTAFGIADGVGAGIWQQWWWVRADGSVLDEFDRFGGAAVFDTGVWHDVEIHVDGAADLASVRVDGNEDTEIPLSNWDASSDGMRCVFVMSGIMDDTVQDVYLDRIHVRAGPDGAY